MISNMSEDLVIEILCRLPVKHIIQCKCVCKAWCTLVATSRFIDFHLNQATMRTPSLLLVSSFHKNFYSLDCERCDEAVYLNFDLAPLTGISIVGSCNGLFCLSDYKSFVLLWNPSTGEHVQLVCDGLVHSQRNSGDNFYESERSTIAMGIGYDSVTEEYKIVRLEYFFDVLRCGIMTEFDRCEVKVYTLGTNSWRRLVDDTPSPTYIGNLSRAAHVKGVLHWIGIRGTGIELSKSIISFDLKNEKFGEISWPEFVDHNYRDLGLGVLQGCLCTFSYHLEHVDVWEMTEYGGSNWTRKFSIARSTRYLEPLVLRENGEILLQRGHRNLILYDPLTEAFKAPTIIGTPDWFRTSTYTESLVTIASLIGMSGH